MNIEDRVRILELRITTIESALIELGNKDLLVKTMQDILKNVEKEMQAEKGLDEKAMEEMGMKHSPCDLEPGIGGSLARDKTE